MHNGPTQQPSPSPESSQPTQPQQAPKQEAARGRSSRGIWWFLLIPVLLAIFGTLTFVLRGRSNKVLAATTQSMVAEAVTVTHPQLGKPENEFSLPSTLQAYSESPIYARTNGYLAHWSADIRTSARVSFWP